MFFILLVGFCAGGTLCILFPILMPEFFNYMMLLMMIILGIVLIWVGIMLYAARSVSTGAYYLNEPAKAMRVLTIHERRGGQARIRPGRIVELEHIRVGKDMIFKDTGGGCRIAGHRVIKTCETVPHNIPDWAAQYVYQIRQRYMLENKEQLESLYKQLKALKKSIPGVMSIEDQLRMIPELNPVMQDEVKKRELLNMSLMDLQQMSELLHSGDIIHYEDYERFQENAAPYDLESYTKRRDVARILEMIHFRDINAPDWMKYVIILVVLFVGAALAFKMIGG